MNAADWRMLSTALLGALVLAGLLCGSGPARAQQTGDPAVLHVAPHGNDAWSGRLAEPNEAGTDGPLATLEGARDAVRDLRAGGTGGPVRVLMHEGVYELPRPLVFEAEDGGTAEAPVRYEAAEGEEVTLRGSRGVVGWEPWRGEIWRADLVAQGLEGVRFHQLFHRGRRQTLARHPNADPGRPRTGGFIYVEDRGPTPAEQFIYAEGDIPFGAWEDISQAEVWTVFGRGWNFALTPITEVDRERRIITTRRVRRPFERMNRYFIQNVLGALDEPGEWFLDYETSVLYYWPPDGRPQDGEVRVPVLDSLIEVAGSMPYPHGYLKVGHDMSREQFPMPEDAPPEEPVEHLWFRGLRLEEARQDGFRLTGARRCEIVGCTVTNVGNVGINLGGVANAHEEVGNPRVTPAEGFSGGVGGGGQNLLFNDPCMACRVIGCDVYDVGSDGIFLYGDGNQAENNHVFNSGLFDKDCACINLWGEENVARRNHLHDVPRNAVFLKGARNVVELNEIHHTMLETCDGGAIRMCQRNLALRGNVIAHNRIVDTIGYGYPGSSRTFQSPYYSWGVYLDDFTCGTRVLGNIIVRTGRGGPMLHGGSDNLVANNIIVDAGDYGVEIAPIRDRPVSGNRVERNVIACDGAEAWVYRCTRWVEGAASFSRNLVWTRGEPARVDLGRDGETFEEWDAWMAFGLDEGSRLADPQFADPASDDYRLQEGSPAFDLGFEAIPTAQIGCYASPERASWPLEAEVTREVPLLYSQPVLPVREDFEIDLAGRPPRHGDVMADGESRIVVTDGLAAGGQHCLEIVDAPGLRQVWIPRIYYPLDHQEGRVRLALSLRLSGDRPPQLYIDPRQYSDTGPAEYFSGPMLHVQQDGSLTAAGETLAQLPMDKWVRLQMVLTLGADAPGSTELTVQVPGAGARTVTVPHVHPEFGRLERLVIASVADGDALFHLDDIIIEPVAE